MESLILLYWMSLDLMLASLFTMPFLVDELFELFDFNPRDYFNYKKKKIHCKYFWDDKTEFTAFSDNKKFLKEVKKKI